MSTDQVRIRSLYAGLDRTIIWFGSVGGGGLAVRNIFLLSIRQGGHRLVCPVRLGHVFGRSGGHLQARPFLSARPGDGAQRRPRIGAERNRASPQPAQILRGPFVSRLSDRHRRYRGLGLRRPDAPSGFSVNGSSRPTVNCGRNQTDRPASPLPSIGPGHASAGSLPLLLTWRGNCRTAPTEIVD